MNSVLCNHCADSNYCCDYFKCSR